MEATEILKSAKVGVSSETFALVSIDKAAWKSLLTDPSLSPRMTAPFMILMDKHEVTLLLDDTDLETMRPGLSDAKIESGYRMLTFDVVLEFDLVGFIAEVARILAEARISLLPLSSYSRDHVLVKQGDLAASLKALGPHVGELC